VRTLREPTAGGATLDSRRDENRTIQRTFSPVGRRERGALRTLQGINTLSAMTILSEMGDLRRFATAPKLMAAVGVVPSEYSTGDKTNRFSITKTGNAHLRRVAVEAAWQYQRRPTLGRTIKARRKDQPKAIVEIAEKCEKRLHARFYRMTSRNKKSTVAVVAVARELLGFIWAIGQIAHP